MRMSNKSLWIILSLIIVFSFTGCNKKETKVANPSKVNKAESLNKKSLSADSGEDSNIDTKEEEDYNSNESSSDDVDIIEKDEGTTYIGRDKEKREKHDKMINGFKNKPLQKVSEINGVEWWTHNITCLADEEDNYLKPIPRSKVDYYDSENPRDKFISEFMKEDNNVLRDGEKMPNLLELDNKSFEMFRNPKYDHFLNRIRKIEGEDEAVWLGYNQLGDYKWWRKFIGQINTVYDDLSMVESIVSFELYRNDEKFGDASIILRESINGKLDSVRVKIESEHKSRFNDTIPDDEYLHKVIYQLLMDKEYKGTADVGYFIEHNNTFIKTMDNGYRRVNGRTVAFIDYKYVHQAYAFYDLKPLKDWSRVMTEEEAQKYKKELKSLASIDIFGKRVSDLSSSMFSILLNIPKQHFELIQNSDMYPYLSKVFNIATKDIFNYLIVLRQADLESNWSESEGVEHAFLLDLYDRDSLELKESCVISLSHKHDYSAFISAKISVVSVRGDKEHERNVASGMAQVLYRIMNQDFESPETFKNIVEEKNLAGEFLYFTVSN